MLRINAAAALSLVALIASAEETPTKAEKSMMTRHLGIPPRLQWTDRAGYCGECSIQQSALYYGNYVSQFVCRNIIDPDQEQDVLVRVNADLVLRALKLKFEEFDTTDTPTPQYKPYLTWAKKHLHQGHPVILTMFDQDDNFWDYDHIVMATGIQSADQHTYHPDDTLYFNDLFKRETQARQFKTLHDSREMKENGAEYYFCIPTHYDFGCAITGIEDETGSLLPIRVAVDRDDEPDVVKKEDCVTLDLEVNILDLKPGSDYVLYRYDDYKHLPTRDYHRSKYLSARTFTAKESTQKFKDTCDSDDASFYRCVPATRDNAISESAPSDQ